MVSVYCLLLAGSRQFMLLRIFICITISGAGSLAVSRCAHWTADVLWALETKPGPGYWFSSGTNITTNLIKHHCRLSLFPLLLPVQPSRVHPTDCYMLGSEVPEDKMLLLLASDKAFKSLGQRFLLDCSWMWKASQTRIYCESYRMIQLLLVTWIPSLDAVTVNIQRAENSIQRDKIWNNR